MLGRGAESLVRLELQQALGDLEEARIRAERYTREAEMSKKMSVAAGLVVG